MRLCRFCNLKLFQSTLPREERRVTMLPHLLVARFQSTLPREERQKQIYTTKYKSVFQSTLPREERPLSVLLPELKANFNPRSHERSDSSIFSPILLLIISIHAPTRGATSSAFFIALEIIISIHAPTRGATPLSCGDILAGDFNPRSHERSDAYINNTISSMYRFQSTLPREERLKNPDMKYQHQLFQSTLPREERLFPVTPVQSGFHFNPRSHERSDRHQCH